ncbi:MAG: NAD(+) diphosphatase [Rhizobiales bacterium]|nr:NAD(+) diphosphatase [Hyphomicrobiales bacterium]
MPTLGNAPFLDRASHKRANHDWLMELYRQPSSRTMVLVELNPVIVGAGEGVETTLKWFCHEDIVRFELEREIPVFLGIDEDGVGIFALALSEHRARAVHAPIETFRPQVDVRSLAIQDVLPRAELAIAGEARALAAWHRAQRCCGHCGGSNRKRDGGWKLTCWACGQDHFPRTDPVVIMLIEDGDRCLLGHEPRFPEGLYSTLAGFVEPGEDIENAVRRETKEEAGIEIGRVAYVQSQPWPFPHSIMIGCWAEALSRDIVVDPTEVVDARWFTREEVRRMLEDKHELNLRVPGRYSIAWRLITRFAEGWSPFR